MPRIKPEVEFKINHRFVDIHPLHRENQPMVKNPIGQLIRDQLKALGKTQGWLAEQAGVSDNAVSKWVKNGQISRERIPRVARLLRIDPALLLSDPGVPATALQAAEPSATYGGAVELWKRYQEATPAARAVIDIALLQPGDAPPKHATEMLTTAVRMALLAAGDTSSKDGPDHNKTAAA